MKQGWLKSKDAFLRAVTPSYSVPIGPFLSDGYGTPAKGNYLIVRYETKSNVAIRHFPA